MELVEIDLNGVQYRKEIAVYDYAKNRVHVSAYSADGNLVFANSLAINHKDAGRFPVSPYGKRERVLTMVIKREYFY